MPRSTDTAGPGIGAPPPGPLPVRETWLALHAEPALHPEWPVIDPHHHLWARPGWHYDADEWLRDLDCGHQVQATVLVQCRAFYTPDGPEALRPVGETAHAAQCGEHAASPGRPRICAGIVGHADLTLGDAVAPVLEAHALAGRGRFRGIRHSTAWDRDPVIANPELGGAAELLADPRFRARVARLAPLGLSYDAWLYHPQIDEVGPLARAFPNTTIVLNHLGGPLGIGRFAGRRAEVFAHWRKSIVRLAQYPNVSVKLGGLAMRISGRDFHRRARPAASDALADDWRPWIKVAIEAFGPQRCMFESNYPVEKASCAYGVLWNAFKRLCKPFSAGERDALLRATAARVYRLDT